MFRPETISSCFHITYRLQYWTNQWLHSYIFNLQSRVLSGPFNFNNLQPAESVLQRIWKVRHTTIKTGY